MILCWGNLAKSADDTTRIEEAIQDYIAEHDSDPNAHMGEDYALGVHRLQVTLDHMPYSIFNTHTYPQVRTYKAIVDLEGNGDMTGIQAAIDYVHSLGGGVILIKNGTYLMTSDLTLYSNVEIIGEDKTDCIIDFQSGEYCINISNINDVKVSNFTIKNSHKSSIRTEYCFNVFLENLDFENNYWDISVMTGSYRCKVKDIYSTGSRYASIYVDIYTSTIGFNQFENIYCENLGDIGFRLISGYNTLIKNVICDGATYDGFWIEGTNLDGSMIIQCQANNCSRNGFLLYYFDNFIFQNCQAKGNSSNGFTVYNVDQGIINACIADGNGANGIEIVNTADRIIVTSNICLNNGTNNIFNNGTNCVVVNNIES